MLSKVWERKFVATPLLIEQPLWGNQYIIMFVLPSSRLNAFYTIIH